MKTQKYHDKRYTHQSAFPHTRKHEVRMMKLTKKLGMNKSELIRHLIDKEYEKK